MAAMSRSSSRAWLRPARARRACASRAASSPLTECSFIAYAYRTASTVRRPPRHGPRKPGSQMLRQYAKRHAQPAQLRDVRERIDDASRAHSCRAMPGVSITVHRPRQHQVPGSRLCVCRPRASHSRVRGSRGQYSRVDHRVDDRGLAGRATGPRSRRGRPTPRRASSASKAGPDTCSLRHGAAVAPPWWPRHGIATSAGKGPPCSTRPAGLRRLWRATTSSARSPAR